MWKLVESHVKSGSACSAISALIAVVKRPCDNRTRLPLRALRALRSTVARWRQPRSAARIARALWIAWAVIVWNVVFDHVIVVAGRRYIHAAGLAAGRSGPDGRSLVQMDDYMRPAVTRGVWIASASAGLILLTGLLTIRVGSKERPR